MVLVCRKLEIDMLCCFWHIFNIFLKFIAYYEFSFILKERRILFFPLCLLDLIWIG